MLPFPDATANTTATPATGLLNWSRTITAGGVATAVFTVAVCLSPALTAMLPAPPAVPGAGNGSGPPGRPVGVAVRGLVPPVGASVPVSHLAQPAACGVW